MEGLPESSKELIYSSHRGDSDCVKQLTELYEYI